MQSDNLIEDYITENAIKQFETQAVNFSYRFINDASVRMDYMSKTKEMAKELSISYKNGNISAKQAAEAAIQMRNEIMEFTRTRTSDMGRAKAKALKSKGLNLPQLLNKYANKQYSKSFDLLTEAEKNKVFLEIVSSSGRSNPNVNFKMKRMNGIGRGLWILTACIAIYNISAADNKIDAAGREAANVGGGFAGGAGGGAVAGIWFGPVGVIIGVVIGGVLGSIISDQIYVEISGPDGDFAKRFIPRFTNILGVDELALANALYNEVRYETEKVLKVFVQLKNKYSTDADDIALIYVKLLKKSPNPTQLAVKGHIALRNYLVSIFDSGWTSQEEKRCIVFLKNM